MAPPLVSVDPRQQQGMTGAPGGVQPPSGLPGPVSPAPPVTPGSLPSMDALSALWGVTNAPREVMAQSQVSDLQQRLGLLKAGTANAMGAARQDAGLARQRLGLERGGLADQRAALNRRPGDIDYNIGRLVQNFSGGQAARGATHTEGTTRGLEDFAREKDRLLFQLGMDRNQVNRMSQNLGIQEQEIGSRLTRALDQMGLSQILGAQDIAQAIRDVEAGRFNPVSELLGMVYQLSGIRPTATPSPSASPVVNRGPGRKAI